MGPTMRWLRGVVREFAAGVDAGNAIRLGLPVRREALRDGIARDAAARDGRTRSTTPGVAAQRAPASLPQRRDYASPVDAAAAAVVANGCRRNATSRERT